VFQLKGIVDLKDVSEIKEQTATSFSVTISKGNAVDTMILIANTQSDKVKWIHAMQDMVKFVKMYRYFL